MTLPPNISPQWLEEQYRIWQQTPQQLSDDWQYFFQGFELARQWPGEAGVTMADTQLADVEALVRSYREHGHLRLSGGSLYPALDAIAPLALSSFGLADSDPTTLVAPRNYAAGPLTLQQLVDNLERAYCQRIGCEFSHIPIEQEQQWLQQRLEGQGGAEFSPQQKSEILQQLEQATSFETFLGKRFVGQKRFSIEGCEGLIPLLHHLLECCGDQGIVDVVMGMPHRGRLNVLTHILDKPLENILAEFSGKVVVPHGRSGDVKYHHGYSTDRQDRAGRSLHVTLVSNPSHLEAVNPVVEGKCRARQDLRGGDPQQVLPLLIHGEAAFAGQGIVAENLNLSQLKGYRTEGTLHLVINNQLGFTTPAVDARSTCYPTDIAKMLLIPIFHVSGDDPEALMHAAELALCYRQKFRKDVVLEIICYRRHGHNENDEPLFTQPLLYDKIRQHPSPPEVYRRQLEQQGLALEARETVQQRLMAQFDDALEKEPQPLDTGLADHWRAIAADFDLQPVTTAVDVTTLQRCASELVSYPSDFTPHPKVADLLKQRLEQIVQGDALDWGSAEALAFATLVQDGVSIRLSGQDSQRGTFSHRHAVLIDSASGGSHIPLAELANSHGSRFQVYNSMLSEAAILGFEYGYSVETPQGLTIWEAQFGDFANGAQVVIDQFISCGESKWNRFSGLVMFLPHGYEGQGAEHSSARIERYLQLCADNNLQVVYPSTPAQLFHLLRRQVRQKFRRPLVVLTPKGLLRHPQCRSSLSDLAQGAFCTVLDEDRSPAAVQRVVLCCGHVYYDLWQYRQEQEINHVALIRIEQLYPLDEQRVQQEVARYRAAAEFLWVQEEPANNGAWSFLRPQLAELLGQEPLYCGRPPSPSTAVGSAANHRQEQQQLVAQAFAPLEKGALPWR